MENMVNVYLFGKQYSVPDNLTIMRAMEYAGYQLVRAAAAATASAVPVLPSTASRAIAPCAPAWRARPRWKTICMWRRCPSSHW